MLSTIPITTGYIIILDHHFRYSLRSLQTTTDQNYNEKLKKITIYILILITACDDHLMCMIERLMKLT